MPDTKDEKYELSEAFRRAIIRWEDAPHNQNGQDKAWVEQLMASTRDHHQRAVRVR